MCLGCRRRAPPGQFDEGVARGRLADALIGAGGRMEGFLVFDFVKRYRRRPPRWRSGSPRATSFEGARGYERQRRFPAILDTLFCGENAGKLLLDASSRSRRQALGHRPTSKRKALADQATNATNRFAQRPAPAGTSRTRSTRKQPIQDHPFRRRFACANATPFRPRPTDPPKILPLG